MVLLLYTAQWSLQTVHRLFFLGPPYDVHVLIASFDGVVSNGPGVLLHAQTLVPPELVGVETAPLQAHQLVFIASVVVHRELTH